MIRENSQFLSVSQGVVFETLWNAARFARRRDVRGVSLEESERLGRWGVCSGQSDLWNGLSRSMWSQLPRSGQKFWKTVRTREEKRIHPLFNYQCTKKSERGMTDDESREANHGICAPLWSGIQGFTGCCAGRIHNHVGRAAKAAQQAFRKE